MYNPAKDGIEKKVKLVSYVEEQPPKELIKFVHCYWELKTLKLLEENFTYHILPDACVNILLDQLNLEVCAVTALQVEHKKLNLGRDFHYVGIQLLPGVWRGNPSEIKSDLVNSRYEGELDLRKLNIALSKLNFQSKQTILTEFVVGLLEKDFIIENPLLNKILSHLNEIQSVLDMSRITGLSTRQLQRRIKDDIRISPHDLLKILRVHQSFKEHYLDYYSDQSHFIHSFRKMTGYTPDKYSKKFNV